MLTQYILKSKSGESLLCTEEDDGAFSVPNVRVVMPDGATLETGMRTFVYERRNERGIPVYREGAYKLSHEAPEK